MIVGNKATMFNIKHDSWQANVFEGSCRGASIVFSFFWDFSIIQAWVDDTMDFAFVLSLPNK